MPPSSRSSPPKPTRTSFPPYPQITSRPGVPRRTSSPEVPASVQPLLCWGVRSTGSGTRVVTEAELFAAFGSACEPETFAVLVCEPASVIDATIVAVATPPLGRTPTGHVTVWLPAQVTEPTAAETSCMPSASESVMHDSARGRRAVVPHAERVGHVPVDRARRRAVHRQREIGGRDRRRGRRRWKRRRRWLRRRQRVVVDDRDRPAAGDRSVGRAREPEVHASRSARRPCRR